MIERRFCSHLMASSAEVWMAVTSLSGINAELMPLVAMRSHDGIEKLSELLTREGIAPVEVTIRLGGVIPIGRATIELAELAEFRFVERSNQQGMRFWQHEREIVPSASGCTLIDNLNYEPRAFAPAWAWLIEKLFAHRHRRLRARWSPGSNTSKLWSIAPPR